MKVKSESEVAQSCPTRSNPMDCSSSVHEIFQARVLEWLYDPTVPLLGLYLDKTTIQKDTCIPMVIAAVSAIAEIWKQPKYPFTDGWIKKM